MNAFNKLPSFAVFREEKQFLNVIHAIIMAMKVSKFLLLQKLLALQPSLTLCLASKEDYFHKVAGPLLAINFCSRQFGHHQRQSLPMMVMVFSKNSMHELFGLVYRSVEPNQILNKPSVDFWLILLVDLIDNSVECVSFQFLNKVCFSPINSRY